MLPGTEGTEEVQDMVILVIIAAIRQIILGSQLKPSATIDGNLNQDTDMVALLLATGTISIL